MYVTLNISNTSVRFLSIKGRQVDKWADAPLASGLVRDGLILQPQAAGEVINTLFKEMKVSRERVIICLSGLPFTYRFLNLPRMKPVLQEEAVLRAARKEIPLPLEELYLFWQPVITRQNEKDFFVAGVTRNLIDAVSEMLASASIDPYLMDLKPLALMRAANRGNAIIASLEPDCYDVVLVAKGLPVIMHTANPRWEGATPEENSRHLVDELLKTINFYNNSHPEEPLDPTTPLLLTGDFSSEASTVSLIQDETGYAVEHLVPQLKFPADLPVAAYTTNIGLALNKTPSGTMAKRSSIGCHDIKINLLSKKYRGTRAWPISIKRILSLLALTAAMAFLFPAYQVYSEARVETMRLQTELSQVDQEIYQSELAIDKARQMEDTISEITESVKIIEQEQGDILAHHGDFTSYLRLVTEALPPQTYCTSIEMGKSSFCNNL